MAEKVVDVTATGTLAVDYFALVSFIPGPDQKLMADGYEAHPGGVSGNVITQLARLGAKTGWYGKIGDDDAGKMILE